MYFSRISKRNNYREPHGYLSYKTLLTKYTKFPLKLCIPYFWKIQVTICCHWTCLAHSNLICLLIPVPKVTVSIWPEILNWICLQPQATAWRGEHKGLRSQRSVFAEQLSWWLTLGWRSFQLFHCQTKLPKSQLDQSQLWFAIDYNNRTWLLPETSLPCTTLKPRAGGIHVSKTTKICKRH